MKLRNVIPIMVCAGIAVALLVGGAQALTQSDVTITNPAYKSLPEKAPEQIELFLSQPPTRPYKEIGIVQVRGKTYSKLDALLERMKKEAAKVGADAIVNIQYGTVAIGGVAGLPTGSIPIVTGTIVIFTK